MNERIFPEGSGIVMPRSGVKYRVTVTLDEALIPSLTVERDITPNSGDMELVEGGVFRITIGSTVYEISLAFSGVTPIATVEAI